MKRVVRRYGVVMVIVLGLAGAGLWWLISLPALGQADAEALPPGWRDLPLPAFVDQARQTLQAQPAPDADVAAAIRAHAAERLRTLNEQGPASFDSLLNLYELGQEVLTADERGKVLSQLKPSGDEVRAWDLPRLRGTHERMGQLRMSPASREALLVGWLTVRSINETLLAGMPPDPSARAREVAWLGATLDEAGPRTDSFSVQWSGSIQAPTDGNYTFSTTPINVNAEGIHHHEGHAPVPDHPGHADGPHAHLGTVQQRFTVWIDGQQVLQAEGEEWMQQQQAVSLAAGQKRSLRVELSYHRNDRPFVRIRTPMARLLWEGPGITRQPVPESALFPPQGDGQGLSAVYRYTANGQENTMTQREAQIDRVWPRGRSLVPKYAAYQRPVVELFWSLVSDPTYVTACETAAQRHVLLQPDGEGPALQAAELLSLSQQAAWARLLLERPKLLHTAAFEAVAAVYWNSRVAAPQESLEVLATWCQMHPDVELAFGDDEQFFRLNLLPYQLLADGVTLQYPPHQQLLEERYLELPDGGCCLPVASILAYAHVEEDHFHEWVERLDAVLADESLPGDRRVSWLLARAQAEELRRARPQWRRYEFAITPVFLAGRGWLETALLEAQSEAVGLRAFRDLIARLAIQDETRPGALALLETAARRYPAAQQSLADWRSGIERLDDLARQDRLRQEEQAQQAYAAALERRRQRSLERSDPQAAGRYERLLRASQEEL